MGFVAGFTSTTSKRPQALFDAEDAELPSRMARSEGCRVWDERGREYVDYIMGLGSVALGYAHPTVVEAAVAAVREGGVGPLPPVLEEALASELTRLIGPIEKVRFLKTGAEAMAAAVRLARVATGRDLILGCGYHGWLDWCQQAEAAGVPAATRALYKVLPFDDPAAARELIHRAGDRLAAVVFEPVIVHEPGREWLQVLREETRRVGALLVVDEIKTVCRLAVGGATERYGLEPDLIVVAKAIANGFPLAAVGGSEVAMSAVGRTWISSTLATEWVGLAAGLATLRVVIERQVPSHLARVGGRLLAGLQRLAAAHPDVVARAAGIPEMTVLELTQESHSGRLARAAARRGLLFKRSAYNFVSLAHDDAVVDWTLGTLDESLSSLARGE
ncbi:MAG TPA: aminotransferase class III-fold pyridoxal phosphate-dependent enzyme [Gemmatimonadales bacterium]|jgi:glutamate-1-semialdehyde 2,1-aminomutase